MTETTADSTRRRAGEIPDPSLDTRAAAGQHAAGVAARLAVGGSAVIARTRPLEWSLTSAAPAGVCQAGWVAAPERAMRALFPGQ